MAKIEEKLVIGIGALALLVLGARAIRLLLAGAVLAGKKAAKSRAEYGESLRGRHFDV